MNQELIAHYQVLLKNHGVSSQAVQYRDRESHYARFKVLSGISSNLSSILDFGCGIADLFSYLQSKGFTGRYLGIDIVPEFVQIAKESLNDFPNADVELISSENPNLPHGYDYAFVSGVFNNRMIESEQFVYDTLRNLYNACEKGIAFNLLSTYVEYFEDELCYFNPMEVFEFLKSELAAYVIMRDDYILSNDGFPYEVTFFAYKKPRFVG